jgi:hypothetical protein
MIPKETAIREAMEALNIPFENAEKQQFNATLYVECEDGPQAGNLMALLVAKNIHVHKIFKSQITGKPNLDIPFGAYIEHSEEREAGRLG